MHLTYPEWLPYLLNSLLGFLGQLMGKQWYINWAPEFLLIVWAVILFTMVAIVAQAAVIFMVLMERKVLAWMTQRKGPNRVGPWGLLQTLADGVKLLFKEDVMHRDQDKLLFTLGPAIFFIPCFVLFAFIPFTDEMVGLLIPAGALLVFALSSISVVGLVISGWASNSKYSLLGGMRSAAQAISYEIPLVLAVLGVVLASGTLNIKHIVDAQFGPFWNWYAIALTPVSFAIFFIASIAEVNRIPFDLPEAESELVSGYNTEYSGMKFALFFLAEYASLFAMSGLTVAFFFGGYHSPLGFFVTPGLFEGNQSLAWLMMQVEMLFWFLAKTYVFIFIAMWWRATLPRLKPDQLMGFSWKFLIPLSLINIFVLAIGKYMLLTINAPFSIMPAASTWLTWAVFAVLCFWGFFTLASNIFMQKIEARLANR